MDSEMHCGRSFAFGPQHCNLVWETLCSLGLRFVVEDGLGLWRDLGKHFWTEGSHNMPAQIQRRENVTVVSESLPQELLLELFQEFLVQQVIGGQSLLTDDSLHGHHILANSISCVHLVGHLVVVLAGHALSDSVLHQTRQRRQNVDGGVDLLVVQLPINVHLALRDVSRKIGNRMRDVIVGHGQNGNLRNGTRAALHTSSTLINGGQIGVHIPGVTTTARHLLTSRGHLTQSVSIRRHVCQDNQHVHPNSVGQVLSTGEGQTGCNDTLDGWVVGQVQEEHGTFHGTVLLKLLLEETGCLLIDTHSGEHKGKGLSLTLVVLRLHQPSLAANLRGNLIVGETGGREQWDLLPTGNRGHDIDG
mmetsp:Transcript_44392/g.74728  ORF Transcript_44392/g.74728 Transcript_44392/m.74728 type:complete len:361 (+) Transcript_44392:445-1527(+)